MAELSARIAVDDANVAADVMADVAWLLRSVWMMRVADCASSAAREHASLQQTACSSGDGGSCTAGASHPHPRLIEAERRRKRMLSSDCAVAAGRHALSVCSAWAAAPHASDETQRPTSTRTRLSDSRRAGASRALGLATSRHAQSCGSTPSSQARTNSSGSAMQRESSGKMLEALAGSFFAASAVARMRWRNVGKAAQQARTMAWSEAPRTLGSDPAGRSSCTYSSDSIIRYLVAHSQLRWLCSTSRHSRPPFIASMHSRSKEALVWPQADKRVEEPFESGLEHSCRRRRERRRLKVAAVGVGRRLCGLGRAQRRQPKRKQLFLHLVALPPVLVLRGVERGEVVHVEIAARRAVARAPGADAEKWAEARRRRLALTALAARARVAHDERHLRQQRDGELKEQADARRAFRVERSVRSVALGAVGDWRAAPAAASTRAVAHSIFIVALLGQRLPRLGLDHLRGEKHVAEVLRSASHGVRVAAEKPFLQPAPSMLYQPLARRLVRREIDKHAQAADRCLLVAHVARDDAQQSLHRKLRAPLLVLVGEQNVSAVEVEVGSKSLSVHGVDALQDAVEHGGRLLLQAEAAMLHELRERGDVDTVLEQLAQQRRVHQQLVLLACDVQQRLRQRERRALSRVGPDACAGEQREEREHVLEVGQRELVAHADSLRPVVRAGARRERRLVAQVKVDELHDDATVEQPLPLLSAELRKVGEELEKLRKVAPMVSRLAARSAGSGGSERRCARPNPSSCRGRACFARRGVAAAGASLSTSISHASSDSSDGEPAARRSAAAGDSGVQLSKSEATNARATWRARSSSRSDSPSIASAASASLPSSKAASTEAPSLATAPCGSYSAAPAAAAASSLTCSCGWPNEQNRCSSCGRRHRIACRSSCAKAARISGMVQTSSSCLSQPALRAYSRSQRHAGT
eukprot:3418623-Pleurochrysis_carterae.AAC.3